MPNLKTDRTTGVALECAALNVRRLMYQSLIWPVDLRYHARRLRSAFHTKHMKRAANSLVDCVGRDSELDGDFLGGQMLVDKEQGIELALAQLGNARRNCRFPMANGRRARSAIYAVIRQITGHQHEWPFTAKDKIRQSAIPLFGQ